MKNFKTIFTLLSFVSWFTISLVAQAPISILSNESGISASALQKYENFLQSEIDSGRIPGAISMVHRKGHTAHFKALGYNNMNLKDPMLKRIDLAYALNAHMAQGLTSDRGIAVMDSRERNLSNQKTFLVTITRLRDHLTLIVDNKERLADRASAQTGEKASSLDTVHRLKEAAQEGQQKAVEQARNQEAGQMPEQAKEISRRHDFGL